MQEGQGDFITNDYRVDIQYRGTAGSPPNAIQWRVIYGDADDLDVRYEPDTAKRFASVFLLNPSTTYHWKFTWGTEIRLTDDRERRSGGNALYDYGMPATDGTYTPNPHYAYLGAPRRPQRQRIGDDSRHDLPQRLARHQPRPESLGSALVPVEPRRRPRRGAAASARRAGRARRVRSPPARRGGDGDRPCRTRCDAR